MKMEELLVTLEFPIMGFIDSSLCFIDLQEFLIDPDFHYHKKSTNDYLIDSNGVKWNWSYDKTNHCCIAGKRIDVISFEEIQKQISKFYSKTKMEEDINLSLMENATIKALFLDLSKWVD